MLKYPAAFTCNTSIVCRSQLEQKTSGKDLSMIVNQETAVMDMKIQEPPFGAEEKEYDELVRNWERKLKPYQHNRKLKPGQSVLLIVDFQEFFANPESHACLPHIHMVEGNIIRLLSAYRKRDLPVIFTRHAHGEDSNIGALGRWWRDPLMDGNPLSCLRFEPEEGEVLVVKDRYDAFYNTELDEVLRTMEAEELVIAGVMTDLCVETTARSAFVRDYDATIVLDATTTQEDKLHLSSLLTLAHGFAVIRRTDEILEALGE